MSRRLYSRLDSRYEPLVSAVEADLLRLFLVTAHKAGRPDCMAEFFKLYGPQLISSSSSSSAGALGAADGPASDWKEWFLLPYLHNPEKEPRFQVIVEPARGGVGVGVSVVWCPRGWWL